MASANISLRPRKFVDWKNLHCGDPLPTLTRVNRQVCSVLPETYDIERLISRREDNERGTLYLVKWANYPIHESTWEPACHIPQFVTISYLEPKIDDNRLHQAARAFESAIKHRLTSRVNQIPVEFDLDIYRYCFNSDKSVMIESPDFLAKLPLTKHWNYVLNKFGRGHAIKFPIRLVPTLRMKKIFLSDNGQLKMFNQPVEKVNVFAATTVCNTKRLVLMDVIL